MYIKRLKLENYRCYREEEFQFLPNEYKKNYNNLSLIEGLEKSGKTTIFNAIGWCLYGEETSVILGEAPQDLEIPNVNTLKENSNARVSVELEIFTPEHSEMDRIIIKRSEIFGKGYSKEMELECHIYYKFNEPKYFSSSKNEGDYIKKIIDTILPQELVEFYMFNGEYLKRTYQTKGKEIEEGIRKQFKIGAISNLVRKLSDISTEYQKKAAKGSSYESLSNQIENRKYKIQNIEDSINKKTNERKFYENEVEKAQQKKEELKEKYGELKEKQKKLQEMEKLNQNKKEYENKLKEEMKRLHESIIKYSYILISKDTLKRSIDDIEKFSGGNKIPPDIKESFLDYLLNQHICICGRELVQGSEEYERLEKLKLTGKEDAEKEILMYINPQLSVLIKSAPKIEKDIKNLKENIGKFYQEIENIKIKLDELSDLNSLNEKEKKIIDDYHKADSDYINFKQLVEEKNKELQNLNYDLKKEKEQLELNLQKLEKETRNESERKKMVEYGKMADILLNALDSLKDKLFEYFVRELETKANQIFKSMEKISSLSLNIKYSGGALSFNYEDKSTIDDKAYISEGQNQIIGICLMAAFTQVLKELGGNNVLIPFIIMDHPFSNLSVEGKKIMAKNLGELFKGSQIIMMVPEGEMDLIAHSTETSNISSIFKVNYDDYSKISKKEALNK